MERYIFRSLYGSFGTTVKIGKEKINIQFQDNQYSTNDKEIADALNKQPKYENKKLVWEVKIDDDDNIETTIEEMESFLIKRLNDLNLDYEKSVKILMKHFDKKSICKTLIIEVDKLSDSELIALLKGK